MCQRSRVSGAPGGRSAWRAVAAPASAGVCVCADAPLPPLQVDALPRLRHLPVTLPLLSSHHRGITMRIDHAESPGPAFPPLHAIVLPMHFDCTKSTSLVAAASPAAPPDALTLRCQRVDSGGAAGAGEQRRRRAGLGCTVCAHCLLPHYGACVAIDGLVHYALLF
jgi:hypothetical protein